MLLFPYHAFALTYFQISGYILFSLKLACCFHLAIFIRWKLFYFTWLNSHRLRALSCFTNATWQACIKPEILCPLRLKTNSAWSTLCRWCCLKSKVSCVEADYFLLGIMSIPLTECHCVTFTDTVWKRPYSMSFLPTEDHFFSPWWFGSNILLRNALL